ncbi:MAG: aspartyl protease family protein [Candidatus Aminicenantes bacterium]|nr:MAG: aspartyl protease family protein [Candidatus Aminicenantes bacterium]
MICRKCHTNNPESSFYCDSCGQPLIRKPKAERKPIFWYVLTACVGVLLVGGYFLLNMILQSPKKDMPSHTAATKGVDTQAIPAEKTERSLIIGGVVVKDLEGREISGRASTVCSETWVAAPVWSLLGGKSLVFQTTESGESPVKKGTWASGDPIILMQLQDASFGNVPELFPWKQYKPLEWHPYLKKGSDFQVDIPPPKKRGSFLSFPLPYEIQDAGVFMQEGHVVGWAFPYWLDYGYLWGGPAGVDLVPDIQMDRFFQSVLTGWRETHFYNVLNRGESVPSVKRLEAFAEGLGMDSRFSQEDVPQQLRSQSIVREMHALSSELLKNGLATEVVRILDEHAIIESQDLALVQDSVLARVETADFNLAIQFLEKIKNNIYDIKGQGISGLDQFHAKLYKDWLRNILDKGGYYSGMVAFEEAKRHFPDDIELHLLGVEVALADKNWARARELLQMRDYPETMRDWIGELENEIQDVQENEGAITIRFNPGAKHIPVKVFLNRTHSFRFILDTGATLCSIPSSAVDRLRINIDHTTPIRLISTAGGYAETYEVRLKSVELEGYRVSDVKALIIDIPGFRDYGLLGQNFLNNFHIEIDNQKGILRLKKR